MTNRLSNLPISLNPGAVSLAEGVRAGIAVAVTVLAGQLFNLPHFGLAALGALFTCFADPGGPVGRRLPAVLSFAVLSGIAYGLFSLLSAQGLWLAALAAGFAIFCGSFARIYGQAGLQVGNFISVITVLALDSPSADMAQAAGKGFNLFVGAMWAALLTLAIWQIHPYQPARRALAQVAVGLGRLARDLAALADPAHGGAAFAAHAAQHRRAVREFIETARGVALGTLRRRGLVSPRAAQLSVRLQTLEQLFGGLIALSDELENNPASRLPASRAVRLIAGWLAAMGPEIENGTSLDTPRKRASLARLRAEIDMLPQSSAIAHILLAMVEHFAVLMTVSAPAGMALSGVAVLPLGSRIIVPIRANLNFAAAPLRHALRTAVIATPVLAASMWLRQPFSHWASITMILCLQPYFSATWLRAAERIAGTALGGVLAALIGLIAQSQLALAFTMLPLTVFAFSIRGVSYGGFVMALTPMVVLLIEQIAPGASEVHVAALRVGYTLLGGTLAVLGNLLLWPGFEHARLEASITQALKAHEAYVRAVFAALLAGTPANDAARRAAGMASNNLEASLARALLEPHKGRDATIEQGAIVDAALRRMAGRLAVLALDRPQLAAEMRPLWQEWQEFLSHKLSGRPGRRPELPTGPGGEALTRLARQAELIAAG